MSGIPRIPLRNEMECAETLKNERNVLAGAERGRSFAAVESVGRAGSGGRDGVRHPAEAVPDVHSANNDLRISL